MAFALFDYLRCDPFEFNFRILTLSGYWPLDTDKRWLQLLHLAYCYLCYFSITSMLFIQAVDLYLIRNQPLLLVNTLSSTSMTVMSVMKSYLLLYRVDKIKILQKQFETFKKSKTDAQDIKILQMGGKQIDRMTKFLYAMATSCVITWLLYPGLDNSKERRIPFPYRLPVEDWSITPIYEILYTYQSMSMVGFLCIIISNDLILFSFMIQISNHYDILIKEIGNLDEVARFVCSNHADQDQNKFIESRAKSRKKMGDYFKKCIQLHQFIIGEIKMLQSIYSAPAVVFFCGVAVTIAALGFDIIVLTKSLQLQMAQRLFYIICSLGDIFFWCYFANHMQDKSLEIAETIYGTSWYKIKSKVTKNYTLLLLRSNRVPMLKIGNVFPINFRTYLDIMKITYNVVTLLYQVVHK